MLATWGCTTFPKPTLSLDFLGATSLDSGITFSRGSQATLFDSTGTLRYAKQNLLTQSEDAVSWTPSQLSVSSNSILAPNGTLTADTLTEDTTTNFHRIQPLAVTFVSGFQYTFSVFLKNGDRNFAQLFFPLQFSTADYANFDISTGALGTVGGSATASIVSVGSGWYRCSVTATATSSGTGAVSIGLITSATAGRAESYLGASKFIYVWGIQLNLANMEGGVTSSLTTYYPTTTAAYYAPRFDYNPSTLQPRGLLIEEQRTNSVIQSEDFAGGSWTKGNATVTSNTIVAPDGTLTGDKLVEDTATNTHLVQPAVSISYTSGTSYTYSVFAKAAERTFFQLRVTAGATFSASFDLSTGVASQLAAGTTAAVSDVGNGWYRCSITFTATATAGGTSRIGLMLNATTNNYLGDGTSGIYIWGAQLEAGAFATSYIPTTTTALTRNADVASMTGTNFSSWYNASEGTAFVQAQSPSVAGIYYYYSINDGTTNEIRLGSASSGSNPTFVVTNSSSSQASIPSTLAAGTLFKAASAYKTDSFNSAVNGTVGTEDTSGTPPTAISLRIGARSNDTLYVNGHIRKLAYYPTRLPDATLQALTA